MAFKFNLEKLLELRKKILDQKQITWAREKSKLNKLHDEREKIIADLAENKKRYSQSYKSKDLQGVNLFRLYISTFKYKIEEVIGKIKTQEQEVERCRVELEVANKDFKILEKLKEKKQEEYFKDQQKKEENFIDEINVMRFKRGKSFGSI